MYKLTPDGKTASTFVTGFFSGPDAMAFDAAGNLFVANNYASTVSKITPAGVVSTFVSGLGPQNSSPIPNGLAFDAAGNLYVSHRSVGTVFKVTTAASIPFTLGGTATAGIDYNWVPASPLIIPSGQTTGTITGTLLPDPGFSPTLTFTLGTPTGASLGVNTTNTLTISEPAPVAPMLTSISRNLAPAGAQATTIMANRTNIAPLSIQQNSIFSNAGLGIDLINGGNNAQAAPVLTSAIISSGSISITGRLNSTANTTTEQVCQATGGPQHYTGKSMFDSHAHLDITEQEWQAFLDDFKQTLDKFMVPEAKRAELFAIVDSTKKYIVLLKQGDV